MNSLTISIVTPSYNQGQFIENTIKSILSQEGDFYLDYIIMDGGSIDNSVEIIKKYDLLLKNKRWAIKCKGISYRWVSEKDNGQVDAINRGFAICKGDILNWINSDDRLVPNSLASVAEGVAINPKAGAWVGGCNLITCNGKVLMTVKPYGLTKDLLAAWGDRGHFIQPSCFFSRISWEKFGPLDETFSCAFDVDLFLKMISEYSFIGIDTLWTEATIHEDAKTQAQIPLLYAEISTIQARHGYEKLAIYYLVRLLKGEHKYTKLIDGEFKIVTF